MDLSSYYTSDYRADALDALRQLRASVAAGSELRAIYKAMAIAEWKVERLGAAYATHAKRLGGYAPPTVEDVDMMLAAVDVEPVKASCAGCDGGRCSRCDHTGIEFEEVAA
jgi:hypothetical protein